MHFLTRVYLRLTLFARSDLTRPPTRTGYAHWKRARLLATVSTLSSLDASNTRLLTLTGITTTTPTPSVSTKSRIARCNYPFQHNASLKTSVRSQNADNCALLTTASTLGLPLVPLVPPLWVRPLGSLHQPPPHQDNYHFIFCNKKEKCTFFCCILYSLELWFILSYDPLLFFLRPIM